MGNVLFLKERNSTKLLIPTVEGNIVIAQKEFNRFEVIDTFEIEYPDQHSVINGFSAASLYSTPLVENNLLYVPFVRQTYYNYPALLCYDLRSHSIRWVASDPKNLGRSFGNIRTGILIFEEDILFINPYSNEVVAVNKATGNVEWIVNLGRPMFQQWASPVLYQQDIFVPRHDGYLYKISGEKRQREWGMYLGDQSDAGVVFDATQPLLHMDEETTWELFKGHSLLSTPAIGRNGLFIGSDEGFLYNVVNV